MNTIGSIEYEKINERLFIGKILWATWLQRQNFHEFWDPFLSISFELFAIDCKRKNDHINDVFFTYGSASMDFNFAT